MIARSVLVVGGAVALTACSYAADVIVENRCPVDVWVRPTSRTNAQAEHFAAVGSGRVPAGATVRLDDEVVMPPDRKHDGTVAVSAGAEQVGTLWPLPWSEADDAFRIVVEGERCP